MQVKHSNPTTTEAVVTIVATQAELDSIKTSVIKRLSHQIKLPGFREGKAPLELVEKNLDQTLVQTEFLEEAINQLYPQAIQAEKLRPVDRPEISIKKFVAFTTLEFEAKLPIVGPITLADYKKVKVAKTANTVTADDITEVIGRIQTQLAETKDVNRAAKNEDKVWMDFIGVDAKGEPIKNADGKDYPLVLGSNTFIPGFEPNLVGLKAGEEKTFDLTFPKDYGVKAMANKKVTFTATVTKVQEVVKPKLDDALAAKAGPFKTVKELKDDIKQQLTMEREQQALRQLESDIVREITKKSTLDVPKVLINEQVDRLFQELTQNLVYRGQTVEEFFASEGMTESEYREKVLAPQAEERVKASLVLTEISEKEELDVTPEELEIRIQLLKGQYKDEAMRAELDKPENRNDIASRMLTEKTVEKLVEYCAK